LLGDKLFLHGRQIFVSTDRGERWDTLKNRPASLRRVVRILDEKYLIADGYDQTVYISRDTANSWQDITSNLRGVRFQFVTSAAINKEYLFVGLDSSGVWRRPLREILDVRKEPVRPPESTANVEVHPNPISTGATIRFSLGAGGPVRIAVFDAFGRQIRTLTEEYYPSGFHQIRYDASHLTPGMYLCVLEGKGFRKANKMLVVR
jgi:hypothetical protein